MSSIYFLEYFSAKIIGLVKYKMEQKVAGQNFLMANLTWPYRNHSL